MLVMSGPVLAVLNVKVEIAAEATPGAAATNVENSMLYGIVLIVIGFFI
jgi:hypothetical protein